jgi:hypothetical protein
MSVLTSTVEGGKSTEVGEYEMTVELLHAQQNLASSSFEQEMAIATIANRMNFFIGIIVWFWLSNIVESVVLPISVRFFLHGKSKGPCGPLLYLFGGGV